MHTNRFVSPNNPLPNFDKSEIYLVVDFKSFTEISEQQQKGMIFSPFKLESDSC